MTILTHSGGPFERARTSSAGRLGIGDSAAKVRLAAFKRFCVCALTVLMAGATLAGIIALKAAIYFWRFHY